MFQSSQEPKLVKVHFKAISQPGQWFLKKYVNSVKDCKSLADCHLLVHNKSKSKFQLSDKSMKYRSSLKYKSIDENMYLKIKGMRPFFVD